VVFLWVGLFVFKSVAYVFVRNFFCACVYKKMLEVMVRPDLVTKSVDDAKKIVHTCMHDVWQVARLK